MEQQADVPTIVRPPEATYGFSDADSPDVGDVELTPVTAQAWRVTDGRLPVHDPFRLLAFVELRGEVFEVMQVGGCFEWHRFDTFTEALDFIRRVGPQAARERLSGDLAWIA